MSATTKTYSFTLFVRGLDLFSNGQIDALHEAGCDDATFGARDGAPYALFDREAGSFSEALRSAVHNLLKALPQLRVVRVEPDDLVTMATIAKRSGRTRESIRLLANSDRGPGDFPSPVAYVDEKTRLWHWPDVAHWLREHGKAKVVIDPEAADLVAAMNAAFDLREHTSRLPPESLTLVNEALTASSPK